jgi:hypothetical protein
MICARHALKPHSPPVARWQFGARPRKMELQHVRPAEHLQRISDAINPGLQARRVVVCVCMSVCVCYVCVCMCVYVWSTRVLKLQVKEAAAY